MPLAVRPARAIQPDAQLVPARVGPPGVLPDVVAGADGGGGEVRGARTLAPGEAVDALLGSGLVGKVSVLGWEKSRARPQAALQCLTCARRGPRATPAAHFFKTGL